MATGMWQESLSLDARLIDKKINNLLEVLPKHILDSFLGIIPSLLDNITLVNSPTALGAGGSFNVVCILDFDRASYDQVISASRALKFNIAHWSILLSCA
uniref:hypothetical protein n=1 Tax=Serratia ficaria TaxID=61651 RepID=UPI0021BD557C|nr:hypothetical protein [Serratia ficaria]